MRIGIDARLIEETGVGRYISNLIRELAKLDQQNQYVLFLRQKTFTNFSLPRKNFQKVLTEAPWHTFREQIVMPNFFLRAKLDVLHVPYFNIPLLYPGKICVTIHDLTILHFSTGKASTRPVWFYQFKRLAYWLVLKLGLSKAVKIITPSNTTKQEVIDHFNLPPEKIAVTLEGVDLEKADGQRLIPEPYLLYVGNAYPHKNLDTLIEAFNEIPENIKLVLVGKEDYFYQRLKSQLRENQRIIFFGGATDRQLANLYAQAIALVFPSRMEGFGLPALEAAYFGCPVICADLPIFHEILGDAALYFQPNSSRDLSLKMTKILGKPKLEVKKIDFTKFSWQKMAKETIQIYESCFGLRPD